MKNLIARFVREEEGQDLVEYALLIAFIALACIIGLQNLGTAINNTYNSISSQPVGRVGQLDADVLQRRGGRPVVRGLRSARCCLKQMGWRDCEVTRCPRFVRDESAQDLVEYALLGVFIGVVSVLVWQNISSADRRRGTRNTTPTSTRCGRRRSRRRCRRDSASRRRRCCWSALPRASRIFGRAGFRTS